LTGREVFHVEGLSDPVSPRSRVTVTAEGPDRRRRRFQAMVRLDSDVELDYYRNGGILPTVLRSLLREA
jgi:aconitate hydratase